MNKYRHEYKYLCSVQQLTCIRNQIETLMYMDANAEGQGTYTIRSLYFDDYENQCLYQNVNGTEPREKFRIRIYNGSISYIRLELKRKEHCKTKKSSCILTPQLCQCAMMGQMLPIQAVDSPVYRKFCILQSTKLLRPKVIVEYDRAAFVYPDGNVRVTFDLHLRSSDQIERFMEPRIASRGVMAKQQHLLEVKFDEYFPDFIYRCVQEKNLQQTTFSKYVICRRYGMGGILL